jgi:hypothetical protein
MMAGMSLMGAAIELFFLKMQMSQYKFANIFEHFLLQHILVHLEILAYEEIVDEASP